MEIFTLVLNIYCKSVLLYAPSEKQNKITTFTVMGWNSCSCGHSCKILTHSIDLVTLECCAFFGTFNSKLKRDEGYTVGLFLKM